MPQPDTVSEIAFVGLGSNLGDPEANLSAALEALDRLPGVCLLEVSPLYRTEPQGVREQPFFVNQVARLCTAIGPHGLLESLLDIEAEQGRARSLRFGPRVLDLDLLLFGNTCMKGEHLTLPHPRMLERAFVLVPLADLVPELVLPQGLRLADALGRLAFCLEGNTIYQRELNAPFGNGAATP